MAEEVARLQRDMNERVERQGELRLREERARMGHDVSTPRRAGPPAPVTPASTPGKRLHSLVQRMWEETEMSVSQAYKEYEDAVDEVESAVNRNPREAPTLLGAADEAKRAWEDAREDLNNFKLDMRTNFPQPGLEAVEKESRTSL